MSTAVGLNNPVIVRARLPLDLFEGDTMLDPKWFVIGVALGVFALAANYDMQLGIAVGTVLAILGAIYLFVKIKLSIEPGQEGSNRAKLARRMSLLSSNRRIAQKREAKAIAKAKERGLLRR